MPDEVARKRLESELDKLNLNIPSSVFQYEMNRERAVEFLKNNSSVPFIVRNSSINGYFVFDIPSEDRQSFKHSLVLPPKSDEDEFKLCNYFKTTITEACSLKDYFELVWDPLHKIIRAPGRLIWQQFKLLNQQNQVRTIAVMSIQSLDNEKIALTAEQVQSYAESKPGLQYSGDGHTGFAMAVALRSPFLVLRSKDNREAANKILKNHIGDNGLIVITGHGNQAGHGVSGHYISLESQEDIISINPKINRSPHEIASSAMESGLKMGNSVTILLCICYGAFNRQGRGSSFAHRLVREFAKRGVSSTILATDQLFNRFGLNAIVDNKITFDEGTGMAAKDVHVITAKVHRPELHPVINVFKPNETIQLSGNGIDFLNPNPSQPMTLNETIRQRDERMLEHQGSQKQVEEHFLSRHSVPGHSIADQGVRKGNKTPIREQSPQEKRFNQHLQLLLNKGLNLKCRRDRINPLQQQDAFHALNDAYGAVLNLHRALKTDGDEYFSHPTIETYRTFKKNCDRQIIDARKILDKHRGWSEFLINLVIGIISVGLGLIVKGGINLALNRSFFYVHPTDSSKKLDEIEVLIDKAKP